jgi:lysyl-tRNA synthetase class I
VKENAYTMRPSPTSQSTVNPSILKMFERYEKIEEFFPELEPHRENNNPVYFTVSNGKPSRENSKSFSSFVSSFDSTMPQKKNTPNDRLESRQKESSDRNGKGTHNFVQITFCTIFSSIFSSVVNQ